MSIYHKWTEDRDQHLAEMWNAGVSSADIARRLFTTVGAILDRRSIIGLPKRKVSGAWSDAENATIREKWAIGWSASQIAMVLRGRSRNAVIGRLHRLGLNDGSRAKPGPKKTYRTRIKAPSVARSHARPPKPGPQKRPALVMGRTFVEGPGSDEARELFRRDGLTTLERVITGAGVESPNARPFIEAKGGCKWPLGEQGEVRLCCNPISRGAYCAGHAAVAYVERHGEFNKPWRISAAAARLTRFDRIDLEPDHRIVHGKTPPRTFRDKAAPTEWDEGRAAA